MRSRLLLVLVLLLVTAAAHAQEAEPAWLEVAGVTLRLRSGPSTDHAIIGQLRPGTALELLQRGDDWSQVRRMDGLSGWAHNDFLRPFDTRNRPDTSRRVGERRLFRVRHFVSGQMVNVNAALRAISDYSYIYAFARVPGARVPTEDSLQWLGEQFDGQVYKQSLDLWGIDKPPAIGNDERVVILIVAGFSDDVTTIGWYAGTGFIGVSMSGTGGDVFLPDTVATLAHEFQHMLHDQTGGNQVAWVSEGLAEFSAASLGLSDKYWRDYGANFFLKRPRTQLNNVGSPDYGASLLFTSYIHERLGLDALRDFATHPRQGLAALDGLLAESGHDMDADIFFADWVLANHLLDTRRNGGRYGYEMMGGGLTPPPPRSHVRKFPAGFREATPPYSADYYELPLPDDEEGQLLLDFRMAAPAPQNAWLQLVQVLPEHIDVQRFRASEHRGQPILASLAEQAERIFIVVSPFTPGARQRTRPVHYSLTLRKLPFLSDDRAQVTTTLRVRSAPEVTDNILGNLQRCSLVQVLERGEDWSRILHGDGLTGWSHNDYFFRLNANSDGASGNSCSSLTRAAHDGDLAAVQRLLAAGHPVNGIDLLGRTALHEAAFWGHDDIISLLLRYGADVNLQDAAGLTAVDDALASGNASSLLLDAAGSGLDLDDPASLPLLVIAAGQGNVTLLERLLARGHNVNWQNAEGETALANAASQGQETTLQQLLSAGADTQLQDKNGRTPLMLAAASGHVGALTLLHEAGGNVNQQDQQEHTALTLAAANGQVNAVAWLLLGSDADVHHTLLNNRRNALHLASAAGHDDVIAQLLLTDLDIGAKDADGQTPLQMAKAVGKRKAAELLHAAGMANETNAVSATTARQSLQVNPAVFLAAARNGDLAEVDRLVRSGIWLNLVDNQGRTALTHASMTGQRAVVLHLLRSGADPAFAHRKAIQHALRAGHDDISRMLLLADGQYFGFEAWPALNWAAEFGRSDVARLLLALCGQRRHCVDVIKPRYDGKTPLHYAARGGHGEIVDMLLAANADPDAQDEWETVPLYFAVLHEHVDIVQSLLDAGASPNTGSTNWLLAACRKTGNETILRMLLKAGARG